MSFFASLADLGKRLMADAENALSRVKDKKTLKHVCQASYLVAMADGTFQDEEKVMLQKVLQRKLPQFKPSEILKEIEAATDTCGFSVVAGKLELRESIATAANNETEARLIMLAVLAVANADNEFADSEKQVAKEICGWLRLNPREYGL